jgi:RimJ/RimL family protein N-acetyltransferase
MIIEWAFEDLGLEKIWAEIRPENIAIKKVVGKLGFRPEGILRKERYIKGKREDVLRIGLLRQEFKKAH